MFRKFITYCVFAAVLGLVASLFTQVYAGSPAIQPATQPTTQASDGAVRIKAGAEQPFTDPRGNKWEADTGFDGGSTIARDADLKIENTDMPDFYRNEHYDMTSWTRDLPNGKYTVKLYFCETYDGIAAAGDRVFSVDVVGQKLKDFDVFKEAGGANKPLIKTFENVPVTDGKLKITFEANVQSPQINGIEVIPVK